MPGPPLRMMTDSFLSVEVLARHVLPGRPDVHGTLEFLRPSTRLTEILQNYGNLLSSRRPLSLLRRGCLVSSGPLFSRSCRFVHQCISLRSTTSPSLTTDTCGRSVSSVVPRPGPPVSGSPAREVGAHGLQNLVFPTKDEHGQSHPTLHDVFVYREFRDREFYYYQTESGYVSNGVRPRWEVPCITGC